MTKFGIGALIASIIFSAGFLGCSQEGNLVIKNRTATEFTGVVDGTNVIVDSGDEYETTVYIGKRLGIVGPNELPVEVSGYAITKRRFSTELSVYTGRTTTLLLVDDTGALNFINKHSRAVNAITARSCGADSFGTNLLERNMVAPNASATIQLGQGCWDIRVDYDRDNLLDTLTAIDIYIGKIVDYEWMLEPVPPEPAR